MFCAEVALKSQVVYGQQQLFSTGAMIQIQRLRDFAFKAMQKLAETKSQV